MAQDDSTPGVYIITQIDLMGDKLTIRFKITRSGGYKSPPETGGFLSLIESSISASRVDSARHGNHIE